MNNLLNIKSFLKFLSKNKSYTFIDVFGLSVSLMFVILIAIYTKQELSTDRFQENADRIYAFSNGEGVGTAYRLAYKLQEQCPEIEMVCPMTGNFKQNSVTIRENKYNADMLMVDSTFFSMFSFELTHGDRQTALASRGNAVISESFARKAFPGMDPMGQPMLVHDSLTVTVNGVMKDIKNSTVQYGDILIRIENVRHFNWSMDDEGFGNAGSANIFVMTYPGTDIHIREATLPDYLKEIFWMYRMGLRDKVMFIPLHEMYFSGQAGYLLNGGDWKFVMILLSIGFVILVFAIINYINLTVAQTGFRAKEMATRRLLGSSRMELFLRLMMESTLLTLFSFLIGMLLAALFVPFANNLLETKIQFSELFTLPGILISVGLILVIGVLAGLIPAFIISNSKPVDVVKGGFRQKTKMVFSKFFITFQNVITIVLLAVSLTMVLQINHLIKAPLGYNTSHIMAIHTWQMGSKDKITTFGNELSQLAGVKQVGYGYGTPFTRGNNNTTSVDGLNISFQTLGGDSAYYKMYGFEILQNNNYSGTDGAFVNQQTFRHLGIPESTPVIKTDQDWEIPVAGVIRDFKLRNVMGSMETVLFRFHKLEEMDYPWTIVVEVQGDEKEIFEKAGNLYRSITGLSEFPASYTDADIYESFSDQRRTSKIVIVFSCVAVMISLLGLLAMSTYFIQQRSREVAVRKVFGSTNSQILKKLVFTFLNYVGIAFVIACPFIWYIMSRWLSDYEYRISLHPAIFLAAGLFCLLISFLSVFWQSYRAANSNPAESVKAE